MKGLNVVIEEDGETTRLMQSNSNFELSLASSKIKEPLV